MTPSGRERLRIAKVPEVPQRRGWLRLIGSIGSSCSRSVFHRRPIDADRPAPADRSDQKPYTSGTFALGPAPRIVSRSELQEMSRRPNASNRSPTPMHHDPQTGRQTSVALPGGFPGLPSPRCFPRLPCTCCPMPAPAFLAGLRRCWSRPVGHCPGYSDISSSPPRGDLFLLQAGSRPQAPSRAQQPGAS